MLGFLDIVQRPGLSCLGLMWIKINQDSLVALIGKFHNRIVRQGSLTNPAFVIKEDQFFDLVNFIT